MNAALQLIKIAQQLTIGVDGFRLYVTDLSIFNVAVSSTGKLKIIDGENIVMVDLEQISKGLLHSKLYIKPFFLHFV